MTPLLGRRHPGPLKVAARAAAYGRAPPFARQPQAKGAMCRAGGRRDVRVPTRLGVHVDRHRGARRPPAVARRSRIVIECALVCITVVVENPDDERTARPSDKPPTMTTGRERMTAIVQDDYGPAPEDVLRVEEIDRPVIGEDEVLVRVQAASVDRGTWHVMAGLPYPIRLAGFGLRTPNPARRMG